VFLLFRRFVPTHPERFAMSLALPVFVPSLSHSEFVDLRAKPSFVICPRSCLCSITQSLTTCIANIRSWSQGSPPVLLCFRFSNPKSNSQQILRLCSPPAITLLSPEAQTRHLSRLPPMHTSDRKQAFTMRDCGCAFGFVEA
jgi:hypothetical protein